MKCINIPGVRGLAPGGDAFQPLQTGAGKPVTQA